MSQYVVLIKASPFYLAPVKGSPLNLYALTTSNHPATGLETLSGLSPIALTLQHSIHAAHRSDYLLRTLEIKFQKQRSHSFWYHFTTEHVAFIQGITAANFQNMIGLIHKAERKSELNSAEVAALLADTLKKAEGALI